jgi:hypothetical protein
MILAICSLKYSELNWIGLNILLTYSTVQSPSWEANWFADSQEIPRISRNPNVHYGTHKRPPPVSILGQPNPVHIPTSHHLEIHPTIIHPPTPRSLQWSPSLRFPHQDPIHPLSSPIRAKNTLIKLPCCIKLAFQIISLFFVVWTLYISECEKGNIKFNGTTRTPRAYVVQFWDGFCLNLKASVTFQSTYNQLFWCPQCEYFYVY